MALVPINEIKNWFKTNFVPTQQQFWDMFDSFRHKSDKVAATDVDGLNNLLAAKASNTVVQTHLTADNAHAALFGELREEIQAQLADSTTIGDPTVPIPVDVTGNAHCLSVGPGTYANWGGMVIPDNNFGTLKRVDGVFSVSLTPVAGMDLLATKDEVSTKANLQAGKNLFNYQDPDVQDALIGGDGNIYQNDYYSISGYIPVVAGQSIKSNVRSGGYGNNFYDANKVKLSTDFGGGVLTVPSGAFYLRKTIIVPIANLSTVQIELGTETTFFEPYTLSVPTTELGNSATKTQFDLLKYNSDLKLNKDYSKNLFNKNSADLVVGFLSENSIVVTESYRVSHYIPVLPNTTYTTSNNRLGGAECSYYDINKNFISNFNTQTFTTPANVYFIRISILTTQLGNTQVEQGSVATFYTPYTELAFLDNITTSISNKLDVVIGKNLFNKNSADIVNGKYLGGGVAPSWGILDNSGYYITGYIQVLPNTTYTHSGFGLGGANHLIFDANKNYVSFFQTDQKTMPSNGYFVRLSGQISSKAIAQFEQGSVATFYTPYTTYGFQEPILLNIPNRSVGVVLPKKMYFLKNKQSCIYFDNILLQSLKASGNVMFEKGYNFKKQTTFNFSASATNQTLNSLVVDNFKQIESKNTTYDVVDGAVNGGKTVNVLHIGDSFTDIGAWVKECKALMNEQGVTYNLIGTCGNSTFKAEGLSGGTLTNTFLNSSSGVARIVNVTGMTTIPQTGYPGTEYSDSNGNVWQIRGGKIDGSGNGKIVVTRFQATTTDFNTFPSSGVLTKISPFEGDATISYSTPVSAYLNPFINHSTGVLDLNNYITYWGFSSPDVVIFQFTWNDLGVWANDVTISALVDNFKLAADHVHSTYPSAKVIFSIEPYGSVNGNLDWNGKKYSVLRFTELMLAQFEDNVSYTDWVKIAPSYAFVDLENGYSGGTVVPCQRYPSITEVSGGDGVHPSTGMLQIADCIAPIISAII